MRKISLCGNIKLLLTVLILFLQPLTIRASDITIDFASSSLRDQQYQLDAFVLYEFDDEVLTALEHGVALKIDTYIKVKRGRNWLWDPLIRDERYSVILERHALSDHYLLTYVQTNEKEQFQYLDEAIRRLGTFNEHFLFDQTTVEADSSYYGYIKAELDIEALPPPLRPKAYFSSQWRAESDWYEWKIK